MLLRHRSENGEVDGELPLALVRSALFGRFLASMPYLNTGGLWAANQAAADQLVEEACLLADKFDVKHLELRHEARLSHPKLNAARTDKVHMRLALPNTDEELNASFKSKLRSQVKKSQEYELSAVWGSEDILNDFYDVFATNMRDLGTPVFSKNLFRQILIAFDGNAELCVVHREGQAIAGALLVHDRGTTEVPSASSLRKFNFTNANMWMYRQLLRRAVEQGSHTFDFGRSSEGSGTYRFKAQWGAQPSPAHWQYYVRKGAPEDIRPDSEGNQRLIKIWQKLPIPLTRLIGPSIVRGIP